MLYGGISGERIPPCLWLNGPPVEMNYLVAFGTLGYTVQIYVYVYWMGGMPVRYLVLEGLDGLLKNMRLCESGSFSWLSEVI